MTRCILTPKILGVILKQDDHDFTQLERKDWICFLRNVSQNRVLYEFSTKVAKNARLSREQREDINKIAKVGGVELEKFRKTIKFLESTLKKTEIPYLIVKTFKFLDYVTFDVDVLVKFEDFDKAQNVLKKSGCQILSHPRKQGLHQRNCRKKGLLNIDLHRDFHWQGLDHIDLDFVWKNPEKRKINGIECLCPSMEVDMLLHTKQLAYERYYITLLDYFAVREMFNSKDFDMKLVKGQVKKYGWDQTFNNLVRGLNEIGNNTSMPVLTPYKEVWRQFFEIIINQKRTTFFDFAYYHFTFLRYFFNRDRIPYYDHWFDFRQL